MPNIAQVLKAEIRRIARSEVRAECTTLKNQVRTLRETLNAQKQTIARMENALSQQSTRAAAAALESSAEEQPKVRLTSASIKRQRTRLKLSQQEMGQLLDVSTNTVVRWEAGTSKPRARHRADLANLRNLGIRTVRKMLEG